MRGRADRGDLARDSIHRRINNRIHTRAQGGSTPSAGLVQWAGLAPSVRLAPARHARPAAPATRLRGKPRYGPPPALRGAALPLWTARPDRVAWATARLDELAALGATCVELVVMGRQRDGKSDAVTLAPSAPSAAELRDIAAAARARNLEVLLLPILELEQLGAGDWRGTLAPRDRDAWWQSYERFILDLAEQSAAAGIGWFAVGSELGSTETWRDRWYHLISGVRRVFPGKLLYSANWDHYHVVSFWPRLDAIGVSSYFSVAATADDSLAAMALRWRKVHRQLAAFAKERELPLLLTEVGVPSRDGAAVAPWDYTRDADVDLEEQRRALAALAAAWPASGVAGVFIWEIAGDGGPQDDGYSPRGKPAWCVLAAWWRAKQPCTVP